MNAKRSKHQQVLQGFGMTDGSPEATPAVESPHDAGLPEERGSVNAPTTAADLCERSVYVIDAHSLIYQVFHALPEMTSPSGQPVSAIYGFIRDIAEILDRKKPDFLLCAFDAPGKTFRHEVYAQYKATRPEMPPDLQLQIPNIQRFLEALSIPVLTCVGYEADDILATVAAVVGEAGGRAVLVTSDKDCRQLITERVCLYDIRRDRFIDAQAVRDQWGIEPAQVVDFQALWGDSTDNVPGVPGVGKKTAAELLNKYSSIEGIYANIDELPPNKRRQRLIESREIAALSRTLVRLDAQVPVALDWNLAGVTPPEAARVEELCQEFGFQRLGRRLAGVEHSTIVRQTPVEYDTVTDLAALRELVGQVKESGRIALDTETTSVRPRWADLVGISVSWSPGQAAYIPVRTPAGDPQLDEATVLEMLRPVLEDATIEKVGQNIKYDMIVLRSAGVSVQGVVFDTMVADYLLSPGQRGHNLDALARRYLNHEATPISELIGTGKKQKRMDEVALEQVAPYAAEDADIPLRLMPLLDAELKKSGLQALFTELELPLIEVLATMEFHGIAIDVPKLRRLGVESAARLEDHRAAIFELAGGEFNIDSPKQLSHVLFDDLGLPVIKKTKTGASTDAEVLNELAAQHALPAKILEYRSEAKLKNTYIDALPTMVCPATGRIHTSFKQDVAATGRLSSTDPNLQNIPVRTAAGRAIRGAFIPGFPEWHFVCADYSQVELRVLAHYSRDTALMDAFAQDVDIHAQVAAQVFDVSLEEVTSEMRRRAKAVNFGVIYGQSAFGLARALGIGKAEAATFIENYFARYPGVAEFIERTLDQCIIDGYVTTAVGRRRAVEGVRPARQRNRSGQRNMPERIAINTVIQGSAADLIKQAMIRVNQQMQRRALQSQLLLQVHDELIFEAPGNELSDVVELARQEMSAAGTLDVPLKVDVKTGPNWADCQPV